MKLIPLTKGFFAKVDDEDFERLSKFRWHTSTCRKGTSSPYATRRGLVGDRARKTIYMHCEVVNTPTKYGFDHIDGDTLNNQKSNLRPASRTENGRNRKIQKHSTPYKGVRFRTRIQKYEAIICVDKNKKFLGYFEKPEDGAVAYDNAALLHFGEFARTNQQMGVLSAI